MSQVDPRQSAYVLQIRGIDKTPYALEVAELTMERGGG